jgi:hypothetical protein
MRGKPCGCCPKECGMPTAKDDLKERLARYRQIKISVIGFNS